MSLSASDVDRILQLLDSSSFDELELEMDGIKLALRRSSASAATAPASTVSRKRPDSPAPPAACEPQAAPASLPPGEVAVNAPLLGTFYRAPKPGAPPYVEVGSVVTPDTIVGILNCRALLLNPTGDLADVIEFPSFVPESMNLLQLLGALQRQKRGLAIVLDEFGAVLTGSRPMISQELSKIEFVDLHVEVCIVSNANFYSKIAVIYFQ